MNGSSLGLSRPFTGSCRVLHVLKRLERVSLGLSGPFFKVLCRDFRGVETGFVAFTWFSRISESLQAFEGFAFQGLGAWGFRTKD